MHVLSHTSRLGLSNACTIKVHVCLMQRVAYETEDALLIYLSSYTHERCVCLSPTSRALRQFPFHISHMHHSLCRCRSVIIASTSCTNLQSNNNNTNRGNLPCRSRKPWDTHLANDQCSFPALHHMEAFLALTLPLQRVPAAHSWRDGVGGTMHMSSMHVQSGSDGANM